MAGDVLEHDTEPVEQDELALVERLWRSGTSATAVSPSTRDDLVLLQRFLAADDRTVLTPLVRRHRVATWRLAAVVTLDARAAAAAVEAAWAEVLAGQGSLDWKGAGIRAWLFGIVRRHAVDHGAAPGIELHLDHDISGVPFDQTGDLGLLGASFALLDEVARTAVWLHAVEGLDDVDVAHVLGLERLETHELIDGAMADLRVGAARGQIAAANDRCRPSLERFLPYLDEDLAADAERDLLLHLGRCRRCAARLDALEAPGLTLVDRVLDLPATLTGRLVALTDPIAVN